MVNSRTARTVGGGGGGIRSFTFSFRVLASAISLALCIFFTLSFLFTSRSYSVDQPHLILFYGFKWGAWGLYGSNGGLMCCIF
ncbi:Galacturonosyltransferase 8 [Senna tora]|uniref:Galacturonosyltransferase 8 n=1 Tax=Senna tora TaxID=362788 RepID=A0A835CBH8_9FABA|nr:Galacturonosyltransferase 8 [Senna tora]